MAVSVSDSQCFDNHATVIVLNFSEIKINLSFIFVILVSAIILTVQICLAGAHIEHSAYLAWGLEHMHSCVVFGVSKASPAQPLLKYDREREK